MQNYIFFLLVYDNFAVYLLSLLLCAVPAYYLGKIYSKSWIDPLRISLILAVFANSVPLFLYFLTEIPSYLFYYFVFAETLFWFGFILFAKTTITFSEKKTVDDETFNKVLFFTFLFLYIFSNTVTYIKFGIPLFMDNRLATYSNSGGFGVFARLNSFLEIYILMFSYYQIDERGSLSNSKFYLLPFLLMAITGILSGSRSSFLVFFTSYFGYLVFFKGIRPNDKALVKFVPVVLIGTLAVFLVQSGGNLSDAFFGFLFRLIATGDCYYSAYPNEIINILQVKNSALFMLSNLLSPLRIIDISTVSPPLGVQMTSILYPILDGLFVGPNSRPPIFGYVLFRWMGLIFSFLSGAFTAFMLFRIPSLISKNFISSVFVFFIYISANRFITDSSAGIGSLFDIMLNLGIVFLLITLIKLKPMQQM